ncbi:MAG: acyl-CoA thioester hydrolase/BAAT C-terminal domain-containing protein [Streptosporangiaceae bacterium]
MDRYGVSRGAEAALLIASYEPRLFDAVIASSPSNLINPAYGGGPGAAWTFRGKALPTDAIIPVGRIRVPLLVGDGGADVVWPSATSAAAVAQELRRSGERAPYTNLYFPAAGHGYLGFPPYSPFPPTGPRETLSVAARRLTLWRQSSSGPR